jgi:hypothetical protein
MKRALLGFSSFCLGNAYSVAIVTLEFGVYGVAALAPLPRNQPLQMKKSPLLAQ